MVTQNNPCEHFYTWKLNSSHNTRLISATLSCHTATFLSSHSFLCTACLLFILQVIIFLSSHWCCFIILNYKCCFHYVYGLLYTGCVFVSFLMSAQVYWTELNWKFDFPQTFCVFSWRTHITLALNVIKWHKLSINIQCGSNYEFKSVQFV